MASNAAPSESANHFSRMDRVDPPSKLPTVASNSRTPLSSLAARARPVLTSFVAQSTPMIRKRAAGSSPAVRPNLSASAQHRASSIIRGPASGQSWRVVGSKSAPFGHTSVCASGSIATRSNTAVSRRAPYSSPCNTGREIDLLLRSVVESDIQHEGLNELERRDTMQGMCHAGLAHLNGSILCGGRPACSRFQSTASSTRWISAQASTSRCCVRGSWPSIRSRGLCRRPRPYPDSTRESGADGGGRLVRRTS